MGKVSRIQLFVVCIIEVVMFAVNEFILLEELQIADVGGSMTVHLFACYFGMAVTFVLRRPDDIRACNSKEAPVYQSDMFAMIGNTSYYFVYIKGLFKRSQHVGPISSNAVNATCWPHLDTMLDNVG
jgi:ammonium transporter Rh